MKYLSYLQNGFVKKFPLKKENITIGRSAENDLIIDDTYLSRHHLRVHLKEDTLVIQDLGSANGTFFQSKAVLRQEIPIGECFTVGRTEIGFMKGSTDEFNVTGQYVPVADNQTSLTRSKQQAQDLNEITDSPCEACRELLEDLMRTGTKEENFNGFISYLSARLSEMEDFGTLFLAWNPKKEPHVLLSVGIHDWGMTIFRQITSEHSGIFTYPLRFVPLRLPSGEESYFNAYPLQLYDNQAALVYVTMPGQMHGDYQREKFLSTLAKEIELIGHIYREKDRQKRRAVAVGKENITKRRRKNKGNKQLFPDDIVAISGKMKQLIQQARRIADSDIFVLIHGESGTGKELFARLIHNNSRRRKNRFVALNCAAIPENLLESELFGHEKGAFTGAYTQRKGKLELASGGTLVLDEIGDMPLNLQAKLLRALQEKAFYPLGGSTPIKVDLRIISLTHEDLKQLIAEKKFREDLYYRLVHRPLCIPPLRERKEDVQVLINFFTNRFCALSGKQVMGYSVKAFEALQLYCWRGNVRELENEINCLVNLIEDNEIIDFDMLSEDVKDYVRETVGSVETEGAIGSISTNEAEGTVGTIDTFGAFDSMVTGEPSEPLNAENTCENYETTPTDTDYKNPFYLTTSENQNQFNRKPDKEIILEFLRLHNWNKSSTARALNMTYQGLHKKMIRLGIQEKGKQFKP